jgi:hypothetical protein
LVEANCEKKNATMIQEEDQDKEWKLCCSKSNKSFIKYITQVCFGASIMIFSMAQIARSDVDNKEIYYSMLSGTVGLFLPHPTLK